MLFKRTLLSAFLVALSLFCHAQNDYQLNLRVTSRNAYISSIHFNDQKLTIYITRQGQVAPVYNDVDGEYDSIDDDGIDAPSVANISPAIEYYNSFDWQELRGKIKSINGLEVTYYDRFDWEELRGKLKTVGNTKVTYYDRFNGSIDIGKVKSVEGTTANVIWRRRI